MEVQREFSRLCLGFRSDRWDKEFYYWYFPSVRVPLPDLVCY